MVVHRFRSKEAYRKWIAYIHIHHIKRKHPNAKVIIAGKVHKVKHSKPKHRKRK